MSQKQPYFFVSYAREDVEFVSEIVRDLEREGINIWIDSKDLTPGSNWETAIYDALSSAAGLIIFISASSVRSKHVLEEFSWVIGRTSVFSILIEDVSPNDHLLRLEYTQFFDIRDNSRKTILQLAEALKHSIHSNVTNKGLQGDEVKEVARIVAEEARGSRGISTSSTPPDSVFIVHGHDTAFRNDVEDYLKAIGVKPIVLSKKPNEQRYLFEKFFNWAGDTRFAIVLMSSDDYGASLQQYDSPDVGAKALQFRARQNVVLELGFFYGLLGWEHVFVLVKKSEKIYPNFERPSDVDGVLFENFDVNGDWKEFLKSRLKEAGFVVP